MIGVEFIEQGFNQAVIVMAICLPFLGAVMAFCIQGEENDGS